MSSILFDRLSEEALDRLIHNTQAYAERSPRRLALDELKWLRRERIPLLERRVTELERALEEAKKAES